MHASRMPFSSSSREIDLLWRDGQDRSSQVIDVLINIVFIELIVLVVLLLFNIQNIDKFNKYDP